MSRTTALPSVFETDTADRYTVSTGRSVITTGNIVLSNVDCVKFFINCPSLSRCTLTVNIAPCCRKHDDTYKEKEEEEEEKDDVGMVVTQ